MNEIEENTERTWRKRPYCPICGNAWSTEYPRVVYMQKKISNGCFTGTAHTKWVKTGDLFCEKCKNYLRKDTNGKFIKI